jgi:lipid II:glycine glycyltransferase (peptidoglycan interpeptide bridge formation enzyme)
VTIQESKDIQSFYQILKETAKRDNFNINPKRTYKIMLKTLSKTNKAKLFLAYHPDSKKPIAGILNTYIKDTATYYYGASDHNYRKYMAPYFLQWHAIQDAKKQNFKYYDFLGVANPQNKKDPLNGVTNFKNKFGGKTIQYKNSEIIIHKPILYYLLKLKKTFYI